jgi:hypothetical protein
MGEPDLGVWLSQLCVVVMQKCVTTISPGPCADTGSCLSQRPCTSFTHVDVCRGQWEGNGLGNGEARRRAWSKRQGAILSPMNSH